MTTPSAVRTEADKAMHTEPTLRDELRAQSGKAFGPWELCLKAATHIDALTAALTTCANTLPHMEGQSARSLLRVVTAALAKARPQRID